MGPLSFTVEHQSGQARVGRIVTAHSVIETPVFMPVGTNGVVKAMMAEQVASLGAQIILGNSYHLYLRPGLEVLREAGGLHRFAGWERSILTDSGGFQVFSLQKLSRLSEEGVAFQSHIDGSRHFFTPELVMEIQGVIGSDIAMVLDDCPALPATPERLAASVTRSLAWAERAIRCERPAHQALFGIVQGGLDLSLRLRHLEALAAMPFDGLAIGGLSVGEPPAEMHAMCRALAPQMPAERPRYLMGVGTPWDLVACAGRRHVRLCVADAQCADGDGVYAGWGADQHPQCGTPGGDGAAGQPL